ncbi:hypothetical protein GIB67_026912 [Kingdonia uniflora]|uniref:Adenylosuccinate lyase PurB C-terminal domain-containing protein n=1 Tax=Kingdonia uniflora TaxID=39325 RepID=A0A7J7P172_9MAGN|nr:hypothetical protein GIB67_026912 [Kingdonia uniflora]
MELGFTLRVSSSIQSSPWLCPTNTHCRSKVSSSSFTSIRSSRGKACSCKASLEDNSVSAFAKMSKKFSEDLEVFELSSLTALSPLDGRYWEKVNDLAPFLSEYRLIRFRVLVEIKWLIQLSQIPRVTEVPRFSVEAQSYLEGLIDGFSMSDALEVHEFFHFACTSEDINNLAHALMLKEALNKTMFPAMDEVIQAISDMADNYAHIPQLSRTHGQSATPTTLGKEMANFVPRLSNERKELSEMDLLGKFAGAVGNYNTHLVAYPEVNWSKIAEEFVKSLGLSFKPYVTQRDLTDSTVLRNIGLGLGHSLLAYKSALQGIGKLQVNEVRLSEDLDQSWEVLAEPIQTVMRRYGVPEPYEKLKELTRGKAVTKESIREFIEGLELPEEAKANLLKLTPHTYIGAAANLARTVNKFFGFVNGFDAL